LDIAESKLIMLDHIVESVTNGAYTATEKNNDYLLMHNRLANIAQRKIATIKKLHDTFYITQNPITNQLGEFEGFDIVQHYNTDLIDTQATGSLAYHFEVDNDATVYIEEEIASVWTTLETINHVQSGTSFTQYKGLISPGDTDNDIRIRFSGSYPYKIINRALFEYQFASASEIPDYVPYVEYELPSDFYDKCKVIIKTDTRINQNYTTYKWKGKKTILINYYQAGEIEVQYYKYPLKIDDDTAETYEYEIDIDAQDLIPLYVASKVIAEEKPTLSGVLYNEFRLLLAELENPITNGQEVIETVDGW
jgi:hypothetical protein